MAHSDLKSLIGTLPKVPKDGESGFKAEKHSHYVVLPMYKADGSDRAMPTLWLHVHVEYSWWLVHYESDCRAWVTDAKDGGNMVQVDHLRAVLTHKGSYPQATGEGRNVSDVHAHFTYFGIPGVPKVDCCGQAFAEKAGYMPWQTQPTCTG